MGIPSRPPLLSLIFRAFRQTKTPLQSREPSFRFRCQRFDKGEVYIFQNFKVETRDINGSLPGFEPSYLPINNQVI